MKTIPGSAGRHLIVAVILLALGSACANSPVIPESADGAHLSDAPPHDKKALSATDSVDGAVKKSISREVLYDLLVAELAGQRNRMPTAVSHYLSAAIASKDVVIAKRATQIALLAGEEDTGLRAAELWAQLDPDSLEAKQAHATFLVLADRIDEALPLIRVLTDNLDLPPDQRLLAVGGLLSQAKDKAASLVAMERMVAERGQDNPKALFALAHFLVRIDQKARALALLERVMAMDEKDPTVYVYYAELLNGEGDPEKARAVLLGALKSGIDHEDVRTNLARLYLKDKQYKKAREQLEYLLAADRKNVAVRYTLALLLLQTGEQDSAREHLRYLIGRDDLRQNLYFDLGQLAEAGDDTAMALKAYRKVTHGEHYLDAGLRIAVLLSEKDLNAARAQLHDILAEDEEESIRLYRTEGALLTEAGNFPEALSVYDAALEAHPEDGDLLYARAMLAGRMGQTSRLEQDLRSLLSREPDHAEALNALGYTLADKTGRYREAMTLIRKALALQPDSYYVLDSMGWVLYRMGRHEESIGYLRRALAIRQDPEVAAHLGEVLWITGDKKAAREVWRTGREAAPDDELLLDVIERFTE
uniref:Tetratricopeptide repeat-containing protein n=1 Tax=Candidatus Kentrum sp. DK TaxID=2126562 RepID=A0A450T7G0_9GAMM|nr:MAG: Tetratricopeptide repeat-containing protein [Candidatus Kentron sp. DK]VFJ62472.1 MAG: Tetratricopeptide repeat-containing protein [Candidatus Kentron sp. DK]